MDGADRSAAAEDTDSSSSSSGDEEDNKLKDLIAQTNATLKESPYHYDSHVELIKLLRLSGDLDGARQARNNMAAIFPLSQGLWKEWLKDELPLSSLSDGVEELSKLYERAVSDYLSVDLWVDYGQFAIEKAPIVESPFEFPRKVFEGAIVDCGLHTTKGSLIWNAYREFEIGLLQFKQSKQQENLEDDGLRSEVQAQFDRVDKLFRRQLKVPLIGMDDTLEEYKSFIEAAACKECISDFEQAKKRLEQLLPFEADMLTSDPPSIESYLAYLKHLQSTKEDYFLTNTVYQRAVADHPLDTGIWSDYTTFLLKEFKMARLVVLKGLKQAVRNCPWMRRFWLTLVRAQERLNEQHDDIMSTFERSLQDNFTESGDYLEVWTAYCDYMRRTIDPDQPDEGNVNKLRELFQRARNELETVFGKEADSQDTLSRYQASLEARFYGNLDMARSLWTDVMTRHGREAMYWLEYANLERSCGDVQKCRTLLERAVNSASDDPEIVCNTLLALEREQGTLKTFETALDRCSAQLKRVKERKEKAAEKEALLKEEKKQQRKERRKGPKQTDTDKSQKQPSGFNPSRKRKRPQSHVVFEDSDQDEEQTVTEKKNLPKRKKDESPEAAGPAFQKSSVELSTLGKIEEEPEKMEVNDGEKQAYDPVAWLSVGGGDKKQQQKQSVSGKESETVFVSNLAFSTTDDQLREVFSKCGELADIRLIKTRAKGGKLNVYAYIEYTTAEPVAQAILMDRSMFNNRPMYVSQCHTKDSKPAAKPSFANSNSKATLYVTHIPHDLSEKDLEEIFQKAGPVKEVRLIRNRQGRSKGFAYIEYLSESSANAGVLQLDDHLVHGKNLQVFMSKPPSKTRQRESRPDSRSDDYNQPFTRDNERGQTQSMSRKSKSHISLLPRALAKKPPPDKEDNKEGEAKEPSAKKSNDDFRQLLLKSSE